MTIGLSQDRIEIHFDVHQPIELTELTLAFQALGRDYRRFLNNRVRTGGGRVKDEDVRLYITKIESNCILAELAGATPILGSLFTLMDYQNIFMEYVRNFETTVNFFRALARKKDAGPSDVENVAKATAQAIADTMAVAAQNDGGRLRLAAIRAGGELPGGSKIYAEVVFTSDEAAEAQRGAILATKLLDYRGDADHKNVLMYFQRTSTDPGKADGKTDDKAIISSIDAKSLPVYFASQLDQARINDMKTDPTTNPFRAAYRVDVNVEKDRHNVARFYRVIHIHEVMPDEGEDIDDDA